MAAKILIIGAGGHGRVVLEALRSAGRKPSFLDGALRGRTIDGAKVEGGDERLGSASTRSFVLAVGVGASPDVAPRRRVYEAASAKGFRFPPVVAASAIVSKLARLEDGAQVLTRAVVHPGAVIGVNAV
ncbi:MAG: sugar acetyltransferase, partial [Elusimicrobia bacterium]|nr:sugar acetyltransferase [Elusimicrobiota bacterium]